MHDLLSSALDLLSEATPGTPAEGSHTIAVTLIITAGTVISGAFGLIVASIQRERSPRAPVADAGLQTELIETKMKLSDLQRKHGLLRRAVHHHNLDPDVLIAHEEAME